MDIIPFSTTGGSCRFPISHHDSMAIPNKSISQYSAATNQSSALHLHLHLLLLLLLLLLISPLFARPICSSYTQLSTKHHSTPKLQPFSISSPAGNPSGTGASDPRFQVSVHEVPSGPNPESNK
ncbi:hypothetical protein V6N13_023130 [Hibiscus sabdariffa]|uniref:Uncharacterized protein n=2 Tax=Hibiscus sabdariffa TaxID=183260 RepID=A0ABR2NWK9_9ROSI